MGGAGGSGRSRGGARRTDDLRVFSPRWLALIALWGFSALSALATGLGFADLRAANIASGRLSAVEVAATVAMSGFVVCAMLAALHFLTAASSRLWVRLISLAFYLFFAVWSVGFGYGFFWKELAGQEFTRQQFGAMVETASTALDRTALSLATAQEAAEGAAELARSRSEEEARVGGACANKPTSALGDGPLTRSRTVFADRTEALAQDLEAVWISPLLVRRDRIARQIGALQGRTDLGALDAAEAEQLRRLAGAAELASAERRTLYLTVYEEIRAFTREANSLRALHAPAMSGRLASLAREVGGSPDQPGAPDPARAEDPNYCWDAALSERLTTAAIQLSALSDIEPPTFNYLEGPQATRAAFFGLASAGMDLFGRDDGSGVAFGAREGLALFASVAVDLGIVFLALVLAAQPARRRVGRREMSQAQGLGAPQPPRLGGILRD